MACIYYHWKIFILRTVTPNRMYTKQIFVFILLIILLIMYLYLLFKSVFKQLYIYMQLQ